MSDKRCPYCGQASVEEITNQEQDAVTKKYRCLSCSEVFGDRTSSPEKHCDTFYFSYGGFFGGYQSLKVEERDGYADLIISPPFSETEEGSVRFRIMLSEWQDIKTTLFYDLFVLDWEDDYQDPDTLDGTQWELRMAFDDRKPVEKFGSNEFPALYDELLDYLKPYFDQADFERD